MIELSVVSPVYNSQRLVQPFVDRVATVLNQMNISYEIVLVDDGSRDGSWSEIERLCLLDERIKGIALSRNFGQHYAITAGLDVVNSNWTIVMDSDLQDQPEAIPELFAKAAEGYDVVLCSRGKRKDNWVKRTGSKMFYSFLRFITSKQIDQTVANYGIYHHKVIEAIVNMRESIRNFAMMVLWVGFKSTTIQVQHGKRQEGKSGYSFRRLLKLALDTVLSYSDKPLEVVAAMGLLISVCTLLAGIVVLFRYFNHSITVQGYTSLLLSIWFLSGLIIATLGIVGLYVGKIFQGIKQRPLYVTRKTVNINKTYSSK